ncbi:MAG: TrkA C-terminal domain-containing protein [Halanaeroarchaeum sp.]
MGAIDEIDKRILYALAKDARGTSAPDIAADLDVSPATIRNRIHQLEERGVIGGYHAQIDYEKTGGRLTYLFICNADPPESEYFAKKALLISGVVRVQEIMSGRRNLQIVAVGDNKEEIRRISRDLSNLGLEIEDEALIQNEWFNPYEPFGPNAEPFTYESDLLNLRELAGDAKVVDVTVAETSLAADATVKELSQREEFRDETVIVAIERGDTMITPSGDTVIQSGDIVTAVTQEGDTDRLRQLFGGKPNRGDLAE